MSILVALKEPHPFAFAYIVPVFDGGGALANDNTNVPFKLNIENATNEFIVQIGKAIQTTRLKIDPNDGHLQDYTSSGTDDFWISYVQLCYQGNVLEDKDPGIEFSLEGITLAFGVDDSLITNPNDVVPEGGIASLIYLENAHENTDFSEVKGISTIVPHEVGHQFGLEGDTLSTDIMGNNASTPRFTTNHINIMRWRIKSPGVN